MTNTRSRIPEILRRHETDILKDWIALQLAAVGGPRRSRIDEEDLREQSQHFLRLVTDAVQKGGVDDVAGPEWSAVRDMLNDVSASRARQGFTPTETAMFVFSMKQPLFNRLRQELGRDVDVLADETWTATLLLDQLGLLTAENYQKTRDQVIARQQQELLELSTPVVKLWEGVVALPLIGTLDSERTQVVMESLLERVLETNSTIAIIDITGVPTVDTLVAQHLLKTVAAARLMGADCIISGIRPQIAQTIVHLGLTLSEVTTKATMADAIALALERGGLRIVPVAEA